jgi:hypothetical protein
LISLRTSHPSEIWTKKSPAEAGLLLELKRLSLDRGEFGRVYIHEAAVLALILEADDTVYFGEEGVVFAAAHVCAGLERGPALADDDASTEDRLASEDLDAQPLSV